jgi:hypothetical protein
VPALATGFPATNPIDHLLAERIVAYQGQGEGREDRRRRILRQDSADPRGELPRMPPRRQTEGRPAPRDLAGALKGGKSDGAAIVPGDPAKSSLLTRIRSEDPDEMMPPKGHRLAAADVALIEQWIEEGDRSPESRPLRRA